MASEFLKFSNFCSVGEIRTRDQLVTLVFWFPKRMDYIITLAKNLDLTEKRVGARRFPTPMNIRGVLP